MGISTNNKYIWKECSHRKKRFIIDDTVIVILFNEMFVMNNIDENWEYLNGRNKARNHSEYQIPSNPKHGWNSSPMNLGDDRVNIDDGANMRNHNVDSDGKEDDV
ncbi:hypothetical protein FNV43_RR13135 [Rhamnella rubrinervis]|uniref:Uncharacterized protein n=1 Tax=Rhamnella rubrinervis TaxID=2594499 RepID=A0A8K0MEX2_9ROSA|nr:hypothetical protein FNV43_RR13135 [Rhamnella rubrinervis]